MNTSEDPVELKLITIGDSGVGKSWLLLRWATGNSKFTKSPAMPTIGIDFKFKNVDIDGRRWDTAGQERFKTLTNTYYRKAQGILLIYDITDRNTFVNIRNWMSQIQQNADNSVNKILVGNKCDLSQQRAVSFEEGEVLAREFKMPFIETSGLSDVNVDQAFMKLARETYVRITTTTASSAVAGKGGAAAGAGGSSAARKAVATQALSSDDFADKKAKKRSMC